MRVLDLFGGAVKKSHELGALGELYNRLQPHLGNAEERRNQLCRSAVASAFNLTATDPLGVVGRAAYHLCQTLLALEEHLYLPSIDINKQRTMAEAWELTATMQRALIPFEEENKKDIIIAALTILLQRLTNGLPEITVTEGDEWASLSVPLYVFLPNLADAVETAVRMPFNEELMRVGFFERLRMRLADNVNIASGIDPSGTEESKRPIVMPSKADMAPEELVALLPAQRGQKKTCQTVNGARAATQIAANGSSGHRRFRIDSIKSHVGGQMLELVIEPKMFEAGLDRRALGTCENAVRWA